MIEYILGSTAVVLLGYSTFIERYAIGLTRLDLHYKSLPKEFDGFTILQISDLHTGHWTKLEQRMEKIINCLDIDLLVLTGDNAISSKGAGLLRDFLSRTRPGRTTYAVYGNTEHKGRYGEKRRADLNWPGLHILTNEHIILKKEGKELALIGVDDPFGRHDDLTAAITGVPENTFKVLLAHTPDIAGEACNAGVHLLLSGHTHGGQIRLPGIGIIYSHLHKYRKLASGLFEGKRLSKIIERDAGEMRVYVSRGVGISNLPVRFLAPPEIVFITLHSSH